MSLRLKIRAKTLNMTPNLCIVTSDQQWRPIGVFNEMIV